jgi:hypothetical protein
MFPCCQCFVGDLFDAPGSVESLPVDTPRPPHWRALFGHLFLESFFYFLSRSRAHCGKRN